MKAKWIVAALSMAIAAQAGDVGVKRVAANLYVQDVRPCGLLGAPGFRQDDG